MRICIFEDAQSTWLEPIALTRPAFALWCGAERLFERHMRQCPSAGVGFWMRPELVELWKFDHPEWPANDADWAREAATIWINGRWLAAPDATIDASKHHIGMMNGIIAYAVLPKGEAPRDENLDDWLGAWQQRLPNRSVSGALLDYLWDIVDHNSNALKRDGVWFRAANRNRTDLPHVAITGPEDQFIVSDGATIEPFVVADTRNGPVMIDRDAVVQSFSRLEGPCYIGKESWIVGGKVRGGTTIGPCSRIGGEVEASIIQGSSNKYHEGFLGHSYIGEWVNIAAATQTSDLRNDYDLVNVTVNGERIATGKSKVGSFIGDHSKTGLSALLNTGSIVGAFANVLPTGSLLPQVIPSFCSTQRGELRELWDLRKVFGVASRVMQRRGKSLTEAHKDFYYGLFESTAHERGKLIRAGEVQKLRKIV